MFRRLHDGPWTAVSVEIDGLVVEGNDGDSVATLLLLIGKTASRRSTVSGEPRGPYCMMGACFECLVRIDGVDNRQACLVPIAHGMRIETGRGKRVMRR